jgi:spore coat-associated protein N
MTRARLASLAVPVTTASLALVTAAWAATGDLPLLPADRVQPLAVTAQATGPLVANDLDGSAVFSSEALAPGETKTGEVTIRNAGDSAGAFTLSTSAASDTGGPVGGPLSGVLDLSVRDVSGTTPVTVFTGKLGALSRIALGTFAPGAAHRYRFELTYPSLFGDNAYQGASTTVRFDWDAVAVGGAATNPTPVAPTPSPSAPAGSGGGATAPSGTATTPSTTTPGPTAPSDGTATGGAGWTVALGTAKKAVSKGRLITWMSSTTASRAKVTGTVTSSGRKLKLKGATVKLTAKRTTVRLKLPAKALAGVKHKITVRLTVTASGGGRKATIRRTLRVSSR